ncbi:MAG: spore protein [Paenibacillus sp.]|nr:spore protein [Paenibacillus sp.]
MAQGQSRSSNTLVVPQANAALDQLKYEVAQELGIAIPQDGYMGNMALPATPVQSEVTLPVSWFKSPSNNSPANPVNFTLDT